MPKKKRKACFPNCSQKLTRCERGNEAQGSRRRDTDQQPGEMAKLEQQLAQAVRSSLNLPDLQVIVRQNKSRRSWSVRLKANGNSSDWLELDSGSVDVVRKIGLLPAIHLGTFRIAYDLLRQTDSRKR